MQKERINNIYNTELLADSVNCVICQIIDAKKDNNIALFQSLQDKMLIAESSYNTTLSKYRLSVVTFIAVLKNTNIN
jgi:hypothetical protein